MNFEWDEAKAAANLAKHDVAFELVRSFHWDGSIIVEDDREDYGEERLIAYGRGAEGEGYVIAFTMRGETYRIISVQRFGWKEYRLYGE